MKLQDLVFKDILEFLPDQGKVLFGKDRILIFRQDAFAKLWFLLQEQLGQDLANAITSQFGYRCGNGDYTNLNSNFDMELPEDRLAMGPMLHTWEGIVHVTPTLVDIKLDQSKFHMKGTWRNSYEAQNYLENFSEPSKTPVCFSLTGYASGYGSAFCGFPVVAIETKCVGKGDDFCEFEIRDTKSWGKEADTWIRHLNSDQGSIHRNLENMVAERTEEIRQQQLKLVDSARLSSLGEMAGGIAHEIKNPLAIISGSVQILLRDISKGNLDPENLQKNLNKILSTVARASQIVDGLKNISRDSSGQPSNEVSLRDIIQDVLGLCSEKFKSHGVAIHVGLESSEFDKTLFCNRIQMSQVFMNLFSNAFDAVCNTKEPWIKIEVESGQEKIRIKLSDSGKGIPAEIAQKIFNPFFTTKDIGKGTGLGLSISKNIVSKCGGSMDYVPVAENTTFVLTFPRIESSKKAA